MKKIETIIRKSRFADVKKALHDVEVNFFSYWDVTGVGKKKKVMFIVVLLTVLLIFKEDFFRL